MRVNYVKLEGYRGIYEGLGRNSIEIDFSRARNRITVISGANGSGKSTLLNALSVLPDNNENFVPSLPAAKKLVITEGELIYEINIIHPIDSKGNRSNTKASLRKNGVELNENGNVSSYKELIFQEFDLDPNFITLSRLSGNDRGLADKRPGERKKFIASISSSLDVYNDMNKTLSKTANVYKNQINTLSSKIQAIGDENNLRSASLALKNRYNKLTKEIDAIKADIVSIQTKINLSDPDGSKQTRYQDLEKHVATLGQEESRLFEKFHDLKTKYSSILEEDVENLDKQISELDTIIETTRDSIKERKANLLVISNKMQDITNNIDKTKLKISKLEQQVNPQLKSELDSKKKTLDALSSDFEKCGLGPIGSITSNEIDQLMKILSDIVSGIDTLYEGKSPDMLEKFYTLYKKGSIRAEIDKVKADMDELSRVNQALRNDFAVLSAGYKTAEVLNQRPKKCKIDSCPFLSAAMEALVPYGGTLKAMEKARDDLHRKIEKNTEKISRFQETVLNLEEYLSMSISLGAITKVLSLNQTIFSKFGTTLRVCEENRFIEAFCAGYRFNELRDFNTFKNAYNLTVEYESIIGVYNELKSEYKTNKNNIDSLNEYNTELENLNTEYYKHQGDWEELKKSVEFDTNILVSFEDKQSALSTVLQAYNDLTSKTAEYEQSKTQLDSMKLHFKSTASDFEKLSELNVRLQEAETQLDPLDEQKKTVDSQIVLLDSYKQEYAFYNENYDVVNKLKKYSSPVAGGIQALFMSIYMNKTLDLANQLLSMIFGGQYRLLDYVINADEFRMPFIGSGMVVDDISSGSTSQICIMGMIINLVLLHQAGTRYNITRLDEIDGGLDHSNRMLFVDILIKIIDILNIDQLFIISHSCETSIGANIDVIQLVPVPDMENEFANANIIYQYTKDGGQ